MNNKIIACMVVKNEVDIIEYTLEQALKWADYILVLDNNSTDGTTDVIKKMSELEQKIIFWGGYGGPFRDSLRAVIYNDYYYLCNDGDWWCRLDADEVYIDNPREFLS
ncbi:TPA: glycosyltransferase family 2 protein, partial [Escherichia coli]|nr:family 2 glycosyl transferase [Escherichia coli]HBC7137235.1 glycosyltransferase family 2 protein [Escherichia coli]